MSKRLEGRIALVTGAARGMGAATARLFASEGATVILGDVLREELHHTANEIGDSAKACHLDVSAQHDWLEAAEIADTLGGLDILVNNAGLLRIRPIEHETLDGFREMLDVNLLGAFLGMQTALPLMQRRGAGSIVNIASVSALTGHAYQGAYGASKWALRGLSRSAAVEWGHHNIRVNCICPGAVNTPMLPPAKSSAAGANRFAHLPLGRAGEPTEIAELAVFLASDAGAWVTGAEFTIDGGSMAGPPPRYEWRAQ